jgi:hypothetical protein
MAPLHTETADPITTEIERVRAGLQAWSKQALVKFGWIGVVPVEDAARVVQALAADLEERLRSTASADPSHDAVSERLTRELEASREAEASLREAAAKARDELNAVKQRSQQIIEEQALQLLKFKRELAEVAGDVERVRTGMAAQKKPANHAIAQETLPVADIRQRRRRSDVVQLDAIDAALADSPPVSQWPRVAV